MNDFDSLGARQQPEMSKPVSTDWQGNPLYQGDVCYLTEDGYVQEEYVQQHFPKIELGGK